MRARGTIVLALFLTLGVCAQASAAPLSMAFTEARANVGKQLDDAALFEPPFTAPLGAQIDPGTGAITAGTLGVPDFETFITDPIEADVTVDFDIGVITGSFDQATGALSLSGEAGGTLTSNGPEYEGEECTVEVPETLTLTTAGSSGGTNPRSGSPFTAGLAGSGAIAGTWDHMDAIPVSADIENVDFCTNVEGQIGGDGGIWLEQKVETKPSPPQTDPPKGNGNPPPPEPPLVCVVPKLAGKTLGRAKVLLRKANCQLGRVGKPKRHKGKGLGPLVVKSTNPAVGSKPANGKVHLKLGPKHPARS